MTQETIPKQKEPQSPQTPIPSPPSTQEPPNVPSNQNPSNDSEQKIENNTKIVFWMGLAFGIINTILLNTFAGASFAFGFLFLKPFAKKVKIKPSWKKALLFFFLGILAIFLKNAYQLVK